MPPSDNTPRPPTGPPPRARWPILAMLLLVLGPLLYDQWTPERARWVAAAAQNRMLDGDWEGARRLLDQALELSPDDSWLRLMRSDALTRLGELSLAEADLLAVKDLHSVRALAPLRSIGLDLAEVIYRQGDYERAIETYQASLERAGSAAERMLLLNAMAYTRARAGRDLQQALEEINQAVALLSEPNEQILDTRGFIHHLLGNDREARDDMEVAVQLAEQDWRERQHEDRLVPDIRYSHLGSSRASLAVLHYHRMLAAQATDPATAAQDEARIRELLPGYNGEVLE